MADLPITIIGGYLGTGKTTLINHLLRNADGLRLAVLVNEFGSLSIDEDLIVPQNNYPDNVSDSNISGSPPENKNIISIAGGCVCCSYGNDLTLAMMDLLELDPIPDHVILESSGVALPGSIAASVSLLSGYLVDGIIVLVNAETIQQQAADNYIGDTITRQLAEADLVILNKTDLIDTTQQEKITHWLSNEVAQAKIAKAEHARLPPEVILQSFLGRKHAPTRANHDSTRFKTVTLPMDQPVDEQALAKLLAEQLPGIVRAKGFAPTLTGQLATIQVVGRRWTVNAAPANVSPNLVVIGQSDVFDESMIRNAVEALTRKDSTV